MSEGTSVSKPDATCDFCDEDHRRKAVVDGKTIFGPWANMCLVHFSLYGIGLGTGRGQRIVD